jgi:hypothetical protein
MTREISAVARLPLERLLGLVEQARVLDRDHAWSAKVCSSCTSLPRITGARRHGRRDRADDSPVAEHRHGERVAR